MHTISRDDYEYLHDTGEFPDSIGDADSGTAAYAIWEASIRKYASNSYDSTAPSAYFWIAIGLPRHDYADKIDFHPSIPMLVPVSGTKVKILGIFSDRRAADIAMEEDEENVHLLYKLRLQGGNAVYQFLEYAASHGMIEKID